LRDGQVDERLVNFKLAVIEGIKPRDQIEAMLAAQMAGIHDAIMTSTRRLANAGMIEQRDSAERALNKLARTFTAQMDTLQRYRNGGEHKLMVQQVSVSDGGQAIVGNVTQAQPDRARAQPETKPAGPETRPTQPEPTQPGRAPPVIPFEPRPAVAMIDRGGVRKPFPPERLRRPQRAQSRK
jgi:hypothetical protein